jgi:hypothetical protein
VYGVTLIREQDKNRRRRLEKGTPTFEEYMEWNAKEADRIWEGLNIRQCGSTLIIEIREDLIDDPRIKAVIGWIKSISSPCNRFD